MNAPTDPNTLRNPVTGRRPEDAPLADMTPGLPESAPSALPAATPAAAAASTATPAAGAASSVPAAPAKGNGKRRVLLAGVALILLVALVGWGSWYYVDGRWFEGTDDAYANGNIVQITPQIPGTIVSISADDNDYVKQRQPLVRFDSDDADVGLAQSEAALARAVRQVRGLYSNVSSLDAEVAQRKVALDRAKSDLQRREDLVSSGAIPTEELAHAKDAYAAAESALNAARQQASTSRALVDDTAIASHPEVQAAVAAYRKSYLDWLRTDLQAPVEGYVAQRAAQVGQRVQPGTPLMAVVPLESLWVDANFKETQLRSMRIGQPVTLKSDLYGDDVVYHGKVAGLGVGTGSAFSLLPAQNATGNWIKIVQRVPVRITLDPNELKSHPLRLGLSMSVEVNLHDTSGPTLAQAPTTQPALTTDIYHEQLADAESKIAKIIQDNSGPQRDAVKQSMRDARPAAPKVADQDAAVVTPRSPRQAPAAVGTVRREAKAS